MFRLPDIQVVARQGLVRGAKPAHGASGGRYRLGWLALACLLLGGFSFSSLSSAGAATPNRLILRFATGDDDLRGGNDNLQVTLLRTNREPERFSNVNGGRGWGNGFSSTVALPLPPNARFDELSGLELEMTVGSGIRDDTWNLDRLLVSARINDRTRVLLDQGARPLIRFSGERRVARFSFAGELVASFITGADDLRGISDNVHMTLLLRTGQTLRFDTINEGRRWSDGSQHRVARALPAGASLSDLRGVRLETTSAGGLGGDNWDLDALQIRVRIAGETRTLVDRRGAPLFRFTGQQRSLELMF
jgi:hypothetical protein